MKDKRKIEQVARAEWEKCEFRKMITPETEPIAARLFIHGFEKAIDHILSLPWPEGLEMMGCHPDKDNEPRDYFENFSPLEECTM